MLIKYFWQRCEPQGLVSLPFLFLNSRSQVLLRILNLVKKSVRKVEETFRTVFFVLHTLAKPLLYVTHFGKLLNIPPFPPFKRGGEGEVVLLKTFWTAPAGVSN